MGFFNESNPLRAMTEHQEMLKLAEEQDNDYGMACAHTALGSISEYAYEYGIEHFEYAIQYLVKSGHEDRLYYIYYQMATLALDNNKIQDAQQYHDKMMNVDVKPTHLPNLLKLYGHPLEMYILFEAKDAEKAKGLYDDMKRMWDNGDVYPQFVNSFAMSMCIYLSQWGNIDEAGQFLDYIEIPTQRMEVEAFYHKCRGDYRQALELTERLDTLRHMRTVEEQRAKVVNANAFYKNKELAAKNLVLEMINTKIRFTILAIVLIFVIVGAGGAFWTFRRHNKELKAERDKTDEQRCIAERERAKAEHLNEMKTAFINNMAHEVRTPLNAIVGFNDMLNNSGLEFSDEDRRTMMEQINVMAGQLTQLLDNVIFMSRLDSKDITPHATLLPVAEVVAEAYSTIADKVKDGLQFDVEQALATTLTVHADRELLIHAIKAVLENAAKFTTEGVVNVSVKNSPAQPARVQIAVTNPSPVIPADAAEQVFERFEKPCRFEPGFGLGLSITRDILRLMGGSIELDTQYIDGNRFVITI